MRDKCRSILLKLDFITYISFAMGSFKAIDLKLLDCHPIKAPFFFTLHTMIMSKLRFLIFVFSMVFVFPSYGQGVWKRRFEQLGSELPTPNSYRTASGAPGHAYWQQRADYTISVVLNDEEQRIEGKETITYYNQSPDALGYLWVQLDQNIRASDSNTPLVEATAVRDSVPAKFFQNIAEASAFDGGFKITSVRDQANNALRYTIHKTMMRIDLPAPLQPGEQTQLKIDWGYRINDRMIDGGRSGYEYFPEDDNYLYAIAQFYPRMAVYDDVEGWQNKQFLGRGEFALEFGDFDVSITAPSDHVVASTGTLVNEAEVLSETQRARLATARTTYDKPVLVITQQEAEAAERQKASGTKTWRYVAENVRDFAFASSRKFIWDAMAVKIEGDRTPLAMSYYPKEGNPLWERESTRAVANTLDTYSRHTIPYPYPVAISVHTASIGMEYPMICFNWGRPKPDGTYSDRVKWSTIAVIVHEVGHNFFPMIINSDERQWTWMDEGLNSFVESLTEAEHYPDLPRRRGPAENITAYMKGDKSYIRPIMTNSEQIIQFGNNAYGKPAAALNILRETIMEPELFDHAFKVYSQRWAFKRPSPADFFRSMEDASGMDLDWFWRGWFYTTDHVDINLANVKWYRIKNESSATNPETQLGVATQLNQGAQSGLSEPTFISIIPTDERYYGEFMNRLDEPALIKRHLDKHFYEVTLKNVGGLVMPAILEWTYQDGSKEVEKIPAEIWRMNEDEVRKVFVKDKVVASVTLDANLELADTDRTNNQYPRPEVARTAVEEFKARKKKGRRR